MLFLFVKGYLSLVICFLVIGGHSFVVLLTISLLQASTLEVLNPSSRFSSVDA